MRKIFLPIISLFVFLVFISPVHAHEAYVLTHNEFSKGLALRTVNPSEALFSPGYIKTSAMITIMVVLTYFLFLIWSTTKPAELFDKFIKKARVIGPLTIRAAISTSFFYAASANSILGPELTLDKIPGGQIIRFLLFALSIMIFFGFLTEIAALIGLSMFIYVARFFGMYMITYANYFGELVALLLFGSRFLSVDRILFGRIAHFRFFEELRYLEVPIVRILYGIALMYAGWTIKLLHQSLSVTVYNQYHLINFFHASAAYIAAGAGLSEVLIGFFIFIGFEQRLTALISLIFITLSIFYFKEMLWPHFMLYGISFSIIINPGDEFTVDRYLIPLTKNIIRNIFNKR